MTHVCVGWLAKSGPSHWHTCICRAYWLGGWWWPGSYNLRVVYQSLSDSVLGWQESAMKWRMWINCWWLSLNMHLTTWGSTTTVLAVLISAGSQLLVVLFEGNDLCPLDKEICTQKVWDRGSRQWNIEYLVLCSSCPIVHMSMCNAGQEKCVHNQKIIQMWQTLAPRVLY
jgi:hypothetical protein